jgi:hypothetical protein
MASLAGFLANVLGRVHRSFRLGGFLIMAFISALIALVLRTCALVIGL